MRERSLEKPTAPAADEVPLPGKMSQQSAHHGAADTRPAGDFHLARQLISPVQAVEKRSYFGERGLLKQRHCLKAWTKSLPEAKQSMPMVIIGIDLKRLVT
jgi:hypothetical protein